MQLKWIFIGLAILFPLQAFCALGMVDSRSRIGGLAGYGLANVSIEGVSQKESPGAFNFYYEQIIDERRAFGVEHIRSLTVDEGELSTAVSFTGFQGKWYPLTPMSQRLYSRSVPIGSYIVQENISPYLGVGTGFAQSSLRDKVGGQTTKGTVGFYFSGRAGVEMPLYKALGVAAEFNFGTTIVGEGQVNMFSMMVGLFIYL